MPPAEAASEPRDCLFSSWKVEAMFFGRVGGAKGFDAGVASVLGMLEVVEGYRFFFHLSWISGLDFHAGSVFALVVPGLPLPSSSRQPLS